MGIATAPSQWFSRLERPDPPGGAFPLAMRLTCGMDQQLLRDMLPPALVAPPPDDAPALVAPPPDHAPMLPPALVAAVVQPPC